MESSDNARAVHYLLRAIVMAGFALYMIRLIRSGTLFLYVAPSMSIYMLLSAVGLHAAATYQLYAAVRTRYGERTAACDCCREPSPSLTANIILYGLFAFPLALGFLLPDYASQ